MGRFLLWPIWILQLFGGAKSFESNPLLGSVTLNRWGLHTGRIRLAHWASALRWWLLAPLAAAELRQRFHAQGYLVLENYLPPEAFARLRVAVELAGAEVREMVQGDTLTLRVLLDDAALAQLPECRALLRRKEFVNLLRYCAATLRWPQFSLQCIRHGANHDPQKDLHADTFHPTMKAWLFLSDADARNGPFTFVPGSQRPSAARLAWEREQSLCAGTGNRYSARGSLRIAEAELAGMGLPPPIAINAKANTLVVANTHGFHRRGDAPAGSCRLEIYASSRSNPFLPLPMPGSRFLARVEHGLVAAYYRHMDRRAAARGVRSSWHVVPGEQWRAAIAGLPDLAAHGGPPFKPAPTAGPPTPTGAK
ncbi:MAG TPA: phytanoyl-CoA dioxygenase family protein [Hyphomicrobiaceae bacterium]|nr:phytanoyl-CoA dioxygenase family protein [Hyphomicrobiaceae bacterium]